MAQHLGDLGEDGTVPRQVRCRTVPQVVKAEIGQAGGAAGAVPCLAREEAAAPPAGVAGPAGAPLRLCPGRKSSGEMSEITTY